MSEVSSLSLRKNNFVSRAWTNFEAVFDGFWRAVKARLRPHGLFLQFCLFSISIPWQPDFWFSEWVFLWPFAQETAQDKGPKEKVFYPLGRGRLTFLSKSTGCMNSWIQEFAGECGVRIASHRQEGAGRCCVGQPPESAKSRLSQ